MFSNKDLHRVHPVPVPSPSWGARPPAQATRNSFSSGVELAMRVAQGFSLLPMSFPRGSEGASSFKWVSFRVAYSAVTTSAIAGRLIYELCCKREVSESQTVGHIGNVAAHVIAVTISLLYVGLAKDWQTFSLYLRKMEALMDDLLQGNHPPGKRSQLHAKLRTISIVLMGAAAIEHLIDKVTAAGAAVEQGHHASFQAMVAMTFKRPASQLLLELLLDVIASFMAVFYVFNDIFIILISVNISYHMRALNTFLKVALRQPAHMTDQAFWSRTRITYNGLAKLTREVDQYLSMNVLVTFTQNLFFICFQLLYFLRSGEEGDMRRYFRIGSFVYVLLRMVAVSMSVASINDASKSARLLLFSVPSRLYCKEVFRLTQQVTTDEIALTGCHFFSVTRSFILTIIGTIATYEIILLQFNKK